MNRDPFVAVVGAWCRKPYDPDEKTGMPSRL